jgi:3-deoxy-D-manno-octulosonate 8-phosphate phosphatase (KDO 8-P phosphatase)
MSDPRPLPEPGPLGAAIRLLVFDFDGVFTDNTVWSDDQGGEQVRCWRGDGLGLDKLRARKLQMWVLSTETHPVVSRRCFKLRIPCRQGLASKQDALDELVAETGVALVDTAYVGNDINDAACLTRVGVPIVVHDAHPDVVALARFRTRTPGGFGAVREVCDWIDASLAAAR